MQEGETEPGRMEGLIRMGNDDDMETLAGGTTGTQHGIILSTRGSPNSSFRCVI
jgi:hypothetical protein